MVSNLQIRHVAAAFRASVHLMMDVHSSATPFALRPISISTFYKCVRLIVAEAQLSTDQEAVDTELNSIAQHLIPPIVWFSASQPGTTDQIIFLKIGRCA